MQDKANLPGTFAACAFFVKQMYKKKCLMLKMKVNVTEYNIHHGANRWRISISIKVAHEHFSLAFTVFEIFTFKNS